jgi:hypothetical protein
MRTLIRLGRTTGTEVTLRSISRWGQNAAVFEVFHNFVDAMVEGVTLSICRINSRGSRLTSAARPRRCGTSDSGTIRLSIHTKNVRLHELLRKSFGAEQCSQQAIPIQASRYAFRRSHAPIVSSARGISLRSDQLLCTAKDSLAICGYYGLERASKPQEPPVVKYLYR